MTAIFNSLGKSMNRPVAENVCPLEAARACARGCGGVFLDSGATESGISLLAAEPDLTLSGGDWGPLEEELEKRRPQSVGRGLAGGAAVGFVAFDGTYRFGFYDSPHLFSHGSSQWATPPPTWSGSQPPPGGAQPLTFAPLMPREEFLAIVGRAREYIAAGDIYQVCLAYPFAAEAGSGSAWDYFERLRLVSPSPFSAFLNFGDVQIASSSPELFLRMCGRQAVTRPIKGTRPRRRDLKADGISAQSLVTSPKEIAELVMITDLERNDLGKVCDYGSVEVPELLRLETYSHVFHLVSTVRGRLREGVSHVRVLRECFPGGSISGAPKKRALEIIRELEPYPRDLYTGAIGYFGYDGESSQFSIAIRTAVFREGRVSFHVGAGIVADSVPENEWQETRDKSTGLLLAARTC